VTAPDPLPCGRWPSPLAAADLARANLRLGSPRLTQDGSLFWLEGRPSEAGRTLVVQRRSDGSEVDLTPPPYNARSRVHEYGGGACAVATVPGGHEIFFVNFSDQAIYRHRPGQAPVRLTADDPRDGSSWRYADLTIDPSRPRLLAVAERHHPALAEPENLLVSIDRQTGARDVLMRGADFYASPTASPDGARLAWLTWNHPHLPWDAAALEVAPLDAAGQPGPSRHVAGDASASVQQPQFGPDGALWFLHEATGYWNLWREGGSGAEPVFALDAELGLPLWQLGFSTWGFLDDDTILAAAIEQGSCRLLRWQITGRQLQRLESDVRSVHDLSICRGRVVLQAGFADRPAAIVELDPASGRSTTVRRAFDLPLWPAEAISRPESVSFPTSGGETAFGFFYPPASALARPLPGEKPPLLIQVHGGPTALSAPVFSPGVQFWTTRGFAVLDLNYRGSTGYGRRYRDRLKGNWGLHDVDDCLAGARALGQAGRVDPARIAIRGSSAGGYTVLAALVRGEGLRAGASHYGVSDLVALARDTHKFESRYCEGLVGPFAERPDLYRERSPITHADRLRRPAIFFQGLDDQVVPPDQTERLVEALRAQGLPTEYHAFAGEQHGFRRADTLRQVLESELAFYQRVLL
jgi:dipeptidyl aminopeptidase/acylaminoacyl peptidase